MDDPDAASDDARTMAMKRARARADLYARAAGLKVLRILSISEGGGYQPPMPVMYARMAMADAAADAGGGGRGFAPGQCHVMFELTP